eukprot:scaffold62153_cov61-Phaeocystis_antarctica.AAC.7
MSPTVMSHIFGPCSCATGCMSSAVRISCSAQAQYCNEKMSRPIAVRYSLAQGGAPLSRTGSLSRLSIFLALGCE